jgi:hypothetical protein
MALQSNQKSCPASMPAWHMNNFPDKLKPACDLGKKSE